MPRSWALWETLGIVEAVASIAKGFTFPLVVDPVMISKHGTPLIAEDAKRALLDHILPVTYLLTPNLPEAAALTRPRGDHAR